LPEEAQVKRLVAVVVSGLGLGALLRRRRHRHAAVQPDSSPAEELRSKLAASRVAETEEAKPVAGDLETRRREVHERARQSLDELG
jgi:hypothetical protein